MIIYWNIWRKTKRKLKEKNHKKAYKTLRPKWWRRNNLTITINVRLTKSYHLTLTLTIYVNSKQVTSRIYSNNLNFFFFFFSWCNFILKRYWNDYWTNLKMIMNCNIYMAFGHLFLAHSIWLILVIDSTYRGDNKIKEI